MNGRAAALMRAVGAFLLTVALVLGVPFLLVTLVGNPFPAELPTVNEIRILLTQNGQGFSNFLIGSLAVLIWAIWAQLIVALIAEIIATSRRTETGRLRLMPGLQGFAARLVAAMTLATVLAAGPLVAPAVGALTFDDVPSVQQTVERVIDMRNASMSDTSAPAIETRRTPAVQTASSIEATMVVDDHTELWDLADEAYGDGVSWKVIARANAGAVDAHGTRITAETESVPPGTELVLPGVTTADQLSRFGSFAQGSQQQVQPGDSMWTIAQDHVAQRLGRPGTEAEIAEYWAQVVAANDDVASGNVDMIYPGEVLEIPAGQALGAEQLSVEKSLTETALDQGTVSATDQGALDQTGESSTVSEPVDFPVADGPIDARTTPQPEIEVLGPADPAPQLAAEPELADVEPAEPDLAERVLDQDDASDSASSTAPALALIGLGTAMMSAGLASAVRRRRDAQRRTRPAGTRAAAPSPEAAAFEASIVHASHELKESAQGPGWRAVPFEARAITARRTPSEIHASCDGGLTAVGRSRIDSPIGEALTDPSPLDDPTEPSPIGSGPMPMAASIIVGTDTTTGDAVLLDLVPGATVALDGSEFGIRRFVRGVLVDLAVSDRADDICVVGVGVGDELRDLERVTVVADYAQALDHIVRSGLSTSDCATPVVVLATAAPAPDDDSLTKLMLAGAAVVAPDLVSETQIALTAEMATIDPSGTQAMMAAFDDGDYRAAAELVETTSPTAIDLLDSTVLVEELLDVAAVADCPVEAGPIELRILGPVEVRGAAPFSSLKAVDVIAFLAFHRHGVDADQIKTWVWPPFKPPTDKAFANVMSRARTGLGAGDDGEPYLSRAGADKTYRLSPDVTTDFDRVRALSELAEQASDDTSRLDLFKQALELIRGVPFTGGSASSFAWADNHVRAQVEYTIDELVHRCADLALELGDLATARWAALKGHELVPGCEQCFRRRFLVAGAGSNRSELRRAMADLEAASMIELGEPEAVDSISGDLLDLYNELDRALVTGTV